jgi:hypothetical protein
MPPFQPFWPLSGPSEYPVTAATGEVCMDRHEINRISTLAVLSGRAAVTLMVLSSIVNWCEKFTVREFYCLYGLLFIKFV